jgi:hypothetical protein
VAADDDWYFESSESTTKLNGSDWPLGTQDRSKR